MTCEIEAALLTGGRSTRMGSDKAFLRTTEGPCWWERQAAVLQAAGFAPTLLIHNERQHFPAGFKASTDLHPGNGPLGGIHTALTLSKAPFVAVLAVDMQRIDTTWFTPLLEALRPGCGALYQRADLFEPLAAIYPSEALHLAEEALLSGRLALQPWLAELIRRGLMSSLRLPGDLLYQSTNYNRPGDPA